MGFVKKSFVIGILVLTMFAILFSSMNIVRNNSSIEKENGSITIEIDPCAEIVFKNQTRIKRCIGDNG